VDLNSRANTSRELPPLFTQCRNRFCILAARVGASTLHRIAFVFVLHEFEDVEAFQRSIREEAVYGIVLIAEELKCNGQLSQ
jgi:hypothetical protein